MPSLFRPAIRVMYVRDDIDGQPYVKMLGFDNRVKYEIWTSYIHQIICWTTTLIDKHEEGIIMPHELRKETHELWRYSMEFVNYFGHAFVPLDIRKIINDAEFVKTKWQPEVGTVDPNSNRFYEIVIGEDYDEKAGDWCSFEIDDESFAIIE